MTFPILGGNSAVSAGAYSIDNSLRFNDDDTAKLAATLSASNRKTFTWSGWVKRSNLGTIQGLFSVDTGASESTLGFLADDTLRFALGLAPTYPLIETTQVFRDVSAWYHIVCAFDTTQATQENRVKLYVNGSQITAFDTASYPPQNADTEFNTANPHEIGFYSNQTGGAGYFDGYMADVHFIDGTAKSPTDFGEFDEDSGIWKPKAYDGSYGTNGFYLDFDDSSSLGNDVSGNNNDFTATNLASTDQTTDTPTNNFCTMNSLNKSNSMLLKEGNLKAEANGSDQAVAGTIGITSGKWYFEFYYPAGDNPELGLMPVVKSIAGASTTDSPTLNATAFITNNGGMRTGDWSTTSTTGLSSQTGESVIGVAVDADNGKMWFTNASGTYFNSGNPATGSNPQATFDADWLSQTSGVLPYTIVATGAGQFTIVNFGQEGSFAGNKTAQGNSDGNGYGDFYYAPPSGYLALCTQNLATELSPTIDDGSQHFNSILYTGTGTTQGITGVGFKPDLVWLKARTQSYYHNWYDSSRGGTLALFSNTNDDEFADTGNLQTFDSDGFTADGFAGTNGSGVNYVAWNWLANGGTTSSNTDGSITSTVQANTTAGFNIVTYTGTGSNATIGHGLGKVPAMMIVKKRTGANDDWAVYHNGVLTPSNARFHYVRLNSTNAYAGDGTYWNDTAPTTSVFTVGTNADVNTSGHTYVAYIFTDIEGYSKFGKYTGNGTGSFGPFADGPFVYTGFKPAWVMIKRIDGANGWTIFDSVRDPFNIVGNQLSANSSGAEEADASHHSERDYYSNGFKLKANGNDINANGASYLYMAFASNPFVSSSGVPNTAR